MDQAIFWDKLNACADNNDTKTSQSQRSSIHVIHIKCEGGSSSSILSHSSETEWGKKLVENQTQKALWLSNLSSFVYPAVFLKGNVWKGFLTPKSETTKEYKKREYFSLLFFGPHQWNGWTEIKILNVKILCSKHKPMH